MRCIGWALSFNLAAWQFGWRKPMLGEHQPAGPVDGDWWLCIGPLALMFEAA